MIADVTDVALEWAERNVKNNPHISELIEIRKVKCSQNTLTPDGLNNGESIYSEEGEGLPSSFDMPASEDKSYYGPPILLDVVRDGESFDFCMSNPPFFETIEEAGLNPKTSCGGTYVEMVCPGGERAFITRIIEDSVVLKQSFRYFSLGYLHLFYLQLFLSHIANLYVLSLCLDGILQWLEGK